MADDNVRELPVRFKKPLPEERAVLFLHEVGRGHECHHLFVQYLISESAAEVECGKCGQKLNPMWVLGRLACDDHRMQRAQERYQEESERLAKRVRTKCQHCGKLTNISRP